MKALLAYCLLLLSAGAFAADGSNDILVTPLASAKVGDVVTVQGTVRTDKDFGSGYSYQVVIEEATVKP